MAVETRARQDVREVNGGEARWLPPPVEVDRDDALQTLGQQAGAFARLVEGISSPDQPTNALKWTLAETAGHVLSVVRYDTRCVRCEETPRLVDDVLTAGSAQNEELMAREPERDPRKLAGLLREAVDTFIQEATSRSPDDPAYFRTGFGTTVTTATCMLICEFLIHGYDIATTLDVPWDLDRHAAELSVYGTAATMPLAVNPTTTAGVRALVQVRVRGGASFAVRIDDGYVTTEPAGARADLYTSVNPVTYLMLGFGRFSPLKAFATGGLLGWGRRPALAFKLPTFFKTP
ncbi:MAG: maleylpyruvate isomerase family mycothiol-dependent enzyme [Actinomycetota bacterium]|nr:maleylpyruvate isomerase family mycothiol-dependent enzyme [Actinomycetota bacterium]